MLNVGCFIPYTQMKHPCTDKGSITPNTHFFHSYIQIICIQSLGISAREILGAGNNSEQQGCGSCPTDLWSSRETDSKLTFFKIIV